MMFGDVFERARSINRRAPGELMMQPMDWNEARAAGLAAGRIGVEIKFDGIGWVHADGEDLTRQGVPFDAMRRLSGAVDRLRMALGSGYVLQGEFVEPDGFDAALASFQRGASETCMLQVFDAVPLEAWTGREISPPLWQRKQMLEAAFEALPRDCGVYFVRMAHHFDVEGVELAFGEALRGGQEGVVAKDMDSPFVRAKSPFWLRVKGKWTVDVPIRSIQKSNGRLDKIICEHNGQPIAVTIGFTEAQRRQLDEFRVLRLVEIEHNGETRDGFLKSPRFKRFRDDKGWL